jgi:GMP synthase-like glutamine amidotransferase
MHFLVFQHIPVEHPGIFRDFMTEDGITWDTIELDEGDSIPELDNYDALIVMGGPMDVWEEDKHPWLITEKEAIRKAIVDFKLPYLGFCLGHQLMADALGGKVSKMPESEVGILNIELTGDGRNASIFSGLQNNIKSLQWHGAEVTEAPPGSRVLAKSPVCAIQALQYGDSAFSLQCHVELTDKTVSEWGEVPEYEQSLEQTLGSGSLEKLNIEAEKYIIDFNNSARLIYNNFIAQLEMHST